MAHFDVIAEMACSHDGSKEHALTIIDAAGQAQADILQLQIWSLAEMIAPSHPVYEVCRRIELSRSLWVDLVKYSRLHYPKMRIYSFVYEHVSIEFTEELGIDGYKLSSADLSNPFVIDRVAQTGKPIHLSVGASTLEEIEKAIKRVRALSQAPLTLMYGYQSFPTRLEDVHLNFIHTLQNTFHLPVGYQDHCDANTPEAFWIPAQAAGYGISSIEKHLTHDRSKKGVDHESALNPDEFLSFVRMFRSLGLTTGSPKPRPFTEAEIKYRQFQKKSLVFKIDLKAGVVILPTHLTILRTGQLGIPPDRLADFIGKTLRQDVKALDIVTEDSCR